MFCCVEDTYAVDLVSCKSELFLIAKHKPLHQCEEDGGHLAPEIPSNLMNPFC